MSIRERLGLWWQSHKPLEPQHRSREAWLAYQAARGLKGDGTKL